MSLCVSLYVCVFLSVFVHSLYFIQYGLDFSLNIFLITISGECSISVYDKIRVKLKESEKKDKYMDFARELKKLWNMKVTIIPNRD